MRGRSRTDPLHAPCRYRDKVSEDIKKEIDNEAMRQGRNLRIMWHEDLQKQLEERVRRANADVLSRSSVHVS